MKRLFIISFISIIFLTIFLFFQINKKTLISRSIISNFFPNWINGNLSMIFDNTNNFQRISNDYNVVFLPKTQFVNLNFTKKKLDFLWKNPTSKEFWKKRKSFFLEIDKDNIFFLDLKGNFYFTKIKDLKNKKTIFQEIKTNLNSNKISQEKVLDFHISKTNVFLSKTVKINECNYLIIEVAKINIEFLDFKKIFTSQSANECVLGKIQGGKIETLKNNQLLVSTSADIDFSQDTPDVKAQDDDSLFGKTLLIDVATSNYEIYNKGHRVSLGLVVDGNYILSTENGPRGGDEINLELRGKNYGWGLASYGAKYSKNELYLDHELNNFQEPIFAFIPSIGISEIIKLNNNFAKEWRDNYLIASLNHKHLIRLKLNKDRSKTLYIENIYIGERIRDLDYSEDQKIIFLALEDTGSIGIISRQ